jgi:hypothetical protein
MTMETESLSLLLLLPIGISNRPLPIKGRLLYCTYMQFKKRASLVQSSKLND